MQVAVKSDGWTRPLDIGLLSAQTIRNWWRLREVLSISRPSQGGEVPPLGVWGGGLTPLSDPCTKLELKTQGRGEREEYHKHSGSSDCHHSALSGSDYRDIIEPSSDVEP